MTRAELGPTDYDELGGAVWCDILLEHCKNCSRIGLVVAKSEEFWSRKRGVIGYVHNVKIINCKSSNWPLKGNSMIICCYRCGTKHSQERKDGEKGYPGHTCARDLTEKESI